MPEEGTAMTAIHELLSEATRAQLAQAMPQLSVEIDTETPARTVKATVKDKVTTKIHKPQVARHQPRLECTPEELLSAAKSGLANRDGHVALSNVTDAELGRMMRAGLLTLVVDRATANHPEVVAARKAQQEAERAALVAERDERKDDVFVLPEFTLFGITVPELDMRSNGELGVTLHELVADRLRSPYDKVRHAMGEDPLDPDTTTFEALGLEHKRLIPHEMNPATKGFLAKVEALVRHAKMTEEQAIEFLGGAS